MVIILTKCSFCNSAFLHCQYRLVNTHHVPLDRFFSFIFSPMNPWGLEALHSDDLVRPSLRQSHQNAEEREDRGVSGAIWDEAGVSAFLVITMNNTCNHSYKAADVFTHLLFWRLSLIGWCCPHSLLAAELMECSKKNVQKFWLIKECTLKLSTKAFCI